jgi:DNA-binding NarL/FixJ family response regulator
MVAQVLQLHPERTSRPIEAVNDLTHHHGPVLLTSNAQPVAVTDSAAAPKRVSARELDVLVLVAQGLSAKEIAYELNLAPRTVDQHILNLKNKTHARNRAHMITIALRDGLLYFRQSDGECQPAGYAHSGSR